MSSEEPAADKRLELAYAAAQDRLKAQNETLANTRTRANNLLATTALFISFSAGVGLINTDPNKGLVLCPFLAAVLLLVVVILGGCVLFIAWPAKSWSHTPSARVILERVDAGEDEATIRRFVTCKMIEGADRNHDKLQARQIAFRVAVALLIVEVALLVGALALY
ncbi:hypothetical protein MMAN_04490 [Mycobacterium mantenii]|uniref:Uncharacterized protein n=1 Tax=Mycobacterium mantenii TaxID=560555 RepID=A0A1X0F534_MYCNT|nr:hypothetical protein [Mycobacterium mantenii]MCV7241179.1 hypothetical protein [Mycobacterium mantenii]ORA96933.1 hypothetical protein BST30_28075 [Mycobacterium mantenii]BBY36315.1 hypothetical protein MMAN_04490 [Mycobacterium mantenii]